MNMESYDVKKFGWTREDDKCTKADLCAFSKDLSIGKDSYKIIQILKYMARAENRHDEGVCVKFINEGTPIIRTNLDYRLKYMNGIIESRIGTIETSPKRQGIGDFLFQFMMEMIFVTKQFLIDNNEPVDVVRITGMLSKYDKSVNWDSSIPFYLHCAEKYKMDFKLSSNRDQNWAPKEFMEKCKEDGEFEMTFSDETDHLILSPNPVIHI